jgi:hypothetical protein
MFIKKRTFFNRKNKNLLYSKYQRDYQDFKEICDCYETALSSLDRAIQNNVTKTHLYNYLLRTKEAVTSLNRPAISHTYQDKFGTIDIVYSVSDYRDLMFKTQKMCRAISEINSAISLIDYLEVKKLSIRSNS